MRETRKRRFMLALIPLLILACLVAVSVGTYRLPLVQVGKLIWSGLSGSRLEGISPDAIVVLDIRLPRMLLALVIGAALSAAGTVFQGLFRNPLVEPYILGISSGSAFGAALSIVLALHLVSLQVTSFLFGIAAMAGAYFLATRRGETPLVNLILAGIVISAVFTAGLSYLKMTAGARELRELTFWLMGGFYVASWQDVRLLAPQILATIALLLGFGWRLNVISMGDEEARSLGIAVGPVKAVLIVTATYITSLSVSSVGIVAWVGLMMPHIARMSIGPDNRYLIPSASLLGATFLVVCDTLARTLSSGEIPISILTSIIGAPYLVYLIRSNRRVFFG